MCDRMESASRGSKSTDGLSPFCHRKCNKNESRCPFLTRLAIYVDKQILNYMDLRFGLLLICKIKQVFSFSRENLGPLLRSVRFHQLVTCSWRKGHWSAPLTDLFCSGSRSPHVQVCTLSLGANEGFLPRGWVAVLTSAPFDLSLFTQMIWIAG